MEEKIKQDLKNAMLAKDEITVSTLRLLSSEINYSRIQKGDSFSDDDVVAVVKREAKKRKEAIQSYKDAGKMDAAQKEEKELEILQKYLPEQMSDEELTKIVEEAITNVGANSMADMGKVMSEVIGKTQGKADGSRVSVLVREKLQQ